MPVATTRGFSLVELLAAMMLFGVLSGVLLTVMVTTAEVQRVLTVETEQNDALRLAVHALRGDLLELSAEAGDILAMSRGSVSYRVMKGLAFLCAPLDTVANRFTVYDADTLRHPVGGLTLDASRDEVLIFSSGSRSTPADDRWVRRRVTVVSSGSSCPGGGPSRTFDLGGVRTPGVDAGAPVRVLQRYRVRAYADHRGDWWLGLEHSAGTGSWSGIQPVVGPIVPSGVEFAYFDRAGEETLDPFHVHRVRVAVYAGGAFGRSIRKLQTDVTLRNGPQW